MNQFTNSVKLILVGFTFVATAACLTAQASAQDIEGYLRKADLDNDGKIEPHEMTGPIKRYLDSKGFDIEERHKIKDVVRQVSPSKQRQPATTSKLKVPKFGATSSEKVGIATFGPAAETVEYSEAVNEKTREVFERNDINKNGVLDDWEISRGSWGTPKPSVNDKNGDGRLTFQELQGRYHDREIAKKRYSQPRDSDRSGGDETRLGGREILRGRNGRSGQGFKPGRGSALSAGAEPNRQITNSNTATDQRKQERFEKAVKQYFESLDLDKNNVIEGDEIKQVNSNSKSKYDKNGDGKITKAEMLGAVSPPTKSSQSTTTKSSARSDRSPASRSRTSSEISSSFAKVDVNEDRLIQMHEFSETWTKKQFDAFLAKDANGDGVISPDEW